MSVSLQFITTMLNFTTKFVFDRKKTASSTKEGTVELRLTYNRKQKYISTGITVLPKNWRSNMVTGRLDALEINEYLDILSRDARRIVNSMIEEGFIDLNDVPRRINELRRHGVDMFAYFRQRISVRSYGKGEKVKYRLEFFLNWLIKHELATSFSEVNDVMVIRMEKLLVKQGLKPSTRWCNYHRLMNSFILDAMADGYIKRNPYKWTNIKRARKDEATLEKHLTAKELNNLMTADMPTDSLERVRDLFVFQCYTCMGYSDLVEFDVNNIYEYQGRKCYSARRTKTGQAFSFLLLRPAEDILDKYHWHLPIISNEKYNMYLKAVAQFAGIDKPLTSHWARHTGATMLLNSGMDMEIVAKVLGHSTTKVTREVYAKLLDETVTREMLKAEYYMGQ